MLQNVRNPGFKVIAYVRAEDKCSSKAWTRRIYYYF